MNTNYKSIILAIGLFLALSTIVSAAPGDLDLSFGSGGKVVSPIIDYPYFEDSQSMLVQPDGKIVVSGILPESFGNANALFFLARYHPTGALDASFGTNGEVVPSNNTRSNVGSDIALQTDGKIVAVGSSFSELGIYTVFAIHRYNANGTLDTSFGTGGVVISETARGGANSVAIQSDGKIVVVGTSSLGFAVVRYNPDGSLDTSFGTGGIVTTPIGNDSSIRKVILQPDGKIVAVGSIVNINDNTATYALALARYNADGSLDSGFGMGGTIINTVLTGFTSYRDAVLQPDGKIVATGYVRAGTEYVKTAIARYNTDGSIDTSFAANGIFTTEENFHVARGIALQSDGKLVAFGSISGGFAVARLNPNGTWDTGFGNNGRVTTPIGTHTDTSAVDGAVQSDGKILAFGATFTSAYDSDIAIVRYLGDSAAAPRPAQFDFDGDRRADLSVFRPSDRTWYLNRSQAGFFGTQFGLSTDKITPADFDGDGKTDIAVFRDGTWYWLGSSNGSFNAIQFGLTDDIPVPADFTGDGRAELAVYRGGVWFTLNLANNQFQAVQFGLSTDKPEVGDYDGDGKSDFAVYRDGTWYLLRSSQGFAAVQFGVSTDRLVPADYDGDGKTDIAVYRDGTWYVLLSLEGFTAYQFGLPSDVPAPADYDGDGRADAAVYRDGVWYLRQSTNGTSIQQFGLPNDKPIPTAYSP